MKLRANAIGLSFTIAILGAVLLFFYFKRMEDELSGGSKVAVLVISKAVEPGGTLRDENLAERQLPQAYVEPRNIRASERAKVVGLKTLVACAAQQSLLWTDLAGASDTLTPEKALQPGMRAYTIQAEHKSAELVNPGDRVDVIVTFDGNANDQKQSVALLQNMLVIGRGASVQAVNSNTTANDLALSVTLHQAQVLAMAQKKGDLSVALVGPDGVPVDHPDVVRPTDLFETPPAAPVHAPTKHGPTAVPAAGGR